MPRIHGLAGGKRLAKFAGNHVDLRGNRAAKPNLSRFLEQHGAPNDRTRMGFGRRSTQTREVRAPFSPTANRSPTDFELFKGLS